MKKAALLILILAIGLLVRLYHLDAQSFWVDEAVQQSISAKPLSYILSMSYKHDVVPPLTFAALHFWLKAGTSDFAVRLLFALVGVANIFAIYLLGKEVIGERAGLIAAALMAANPFHIWYSQEARPYIFLMFFCTCHVLFFMRSLTRGGWRNWLAFALFAEAALYTHPSALFTLFVEFCYGASVARSKKFWSAYIVTGGIVLACFLPYVSAQLMRTLELPLGHRKPISLLVIPFAAYSWIFGFSVGPSLTELHRHLSTRAYLSYLPWMVPTLMALAIIAWFQVKGRIGKAAPSGTGERDPAYAHDTVRMVTFLLVWIIVPLAVVFLLSINPRSTFTFNVRYCSEAFVPFILLTAWSMASLPASRAWIVAALTLTLLGSAVSLGRLYRIDKYWKEDVRSSGRILDREARAGDMILVPDYYAVQHYYKGAALVRPMPDVIDRNGSITIKPEKVDRIWLVYYREWALDPGGKVKSWLDEHLKQKGEYYLPNCTVFRYEH